MSPRRRIRNRPEQQIQIACVGYLNAALPGNHVVWHTVNEGKRSAVEGFKLKQMGLVVGFPDVALLVNGRLFVAECKAPGQDTTAAQDDCINRLLAAGATYLGVWRSINDCEAACRAAGIPVHGTALPGGGWHVRAGVRRAAA